MSHWYTTEGATPDEEAAAQERLVAAWEDAPLSNLEVCGMLLDVARQAVVAFAPEPGEGDDLDGNPPANYVLAQLQQATNLWNAGRVASDGNLGDGTFTFTPRPLDKTIKSIIRPIDGKPDVY